MTLPPTDPSARLPEKRPLSLLALAVVLLILGVILTPSLLIKLGPMRGSLTHPNPMVQRTTHLEVNVVRALCLAGGAVLVLVFAAWRSFRDSRLVAGVLDYPLNETDDRRQRRVNNGSLWLMLASVVLWIVYLKVGAYVFSPSAIAFINREDGVVEGGTALCFLIASIAAAVLAFRSRYKPRKLFAFVLAVGFFMCMGEEMSWGQHIFGWKTPESLAHVNVQAETNLHNMSGYFADHVFIAGTLLYGGIVPIMAAVSPVWRRIFGHFGVIVGSVGLAVGFIVVTLNQPYLIGKWIGHKDAVVTEDPHGRKVNHPDPNSDGRPQNPIRIQEGRELLSGLGYAVLIFEALRALRLATSSEREAALAAATPSPHAVPTAR